MVLLIWVAVFEANVTEHRPLSLSLQNVNSIRSTELFGQIVCPSLWLPTWYKTINLVSHCIEIESEF